MKILKCLLMIVTAPVILVLTLFVWLCTGLIYISGLVLGLLSTVRRTPLTIEISLLLSGVSVAFAIFFGICSKQRNEKKDTQEDAEQRATTDTMVMMKLENIADDLKDIKRESRENREEMKSLRDRVVIVEQSLKSYHKRLDGEQHSDR